MNYQQGPYGMPPQQGYGAPPPQRPTLTITAKSPGIAVMLELLPGFFFQTFGIGNMYAGSTGAGIALMLGYWVLTGINFALCFVFIGFITWPLSWLAAMIVSSILASNAAKTANQAALRGHVS